VTNGAILAAIQGADQRVIKRIRITMARQDKDPLDDLDIQGLADLDAARGPRGRARSDELPENEELDSEGQPDLEGALPGKEITGDAQEGEIPPGDYQRVLDDTVHIDTLDERLREEVPDRVTADVEEVRLLDDESDDGGEPDAGGGELRSELGDEGGYPSAEEAAMHLVKEAPGAVNRKIDSYTGDPIDELE
jgi:hypothetical protein